MLYGISLLFLSLGIFNMIFPVPRWVFLVCAVFTCLITFSENISLLSKTGKTTFHKIVFIVGYILSLTAIPISFIVLLFAFNRNLEEAIDSFSLIAFGLTLTQMYTKERLSSL